MSALLHFLCIMFSRGAMASGHPLDPDKEALEAYVAAYQFIRKVSGRPDPKKVVAHLNHAVNKLEHGAESSLLCLGVPKENFKEGLPEDIKASENTSEELEELTLDKNCQIDVDNYYVIDRAIPRHRLGQNVYY